MSIFLQALWSFLFGSYALVFLFERFFIIVPVFGFFAFRYGSNALKMIRQNQSVRSAK